MSHAPARPAAPRQGGLFRRFARARGGIAAIEFALLAPLLLSMYFVTMEVAQGIETNKKTSRVGSMVADLITQQQDSIQKAEVDAIMQIGEALLQPYNRTKPTIVVTAIKVSTDSTPKVTVAWSRKLVNGAASKDANAGTTTTLPAKLVVPGSFVIRVTSSLNYKPVIVYTAGEKSTLGLTAAFDNIQMGETYFLRPRMSTEIACPDC